MIKRTYENIALGIVGVGAVVGISIADYFVRGANEYNTEMLVTQVREIADKNRDNCLSISELASLLAAGAQITEDKKIEMSFTDIERYLINRGVNPIHTPFS